MKLKVFTIFLISVMLLCNCFAVLVPRAEAQTVESILTMSGKDWSLSVDSLQTVLDSQEKSSVLSKSTTKELFLTLSSLKDCVSGVVEWRISTQGILVYKQLPLDKELNVTEYDFVNATVAMRKEQVVVSRPENVVNSFACFDAGGRKVLHIYASELVDAKGNRIWCDSNLKGGVLSVVLPMKWLEDAVFPVVVDPTFGYTSIGGTGDNDRLNYILGCLSECGGTGNIVSISLYATGVAGNGRVACYSDSAGEPDGSPSESSSDVLSEGWTVFTVSKAVVEDNFYWLCFQVSSGSPTLYWDAGADNSYLYKTFTYGVFPSSLVPDGYYIKKFSIYASYEVEEDSYVSELTINEPEAIEYNTAAVDWDVGWSGNDTSVVYNAGFYNSTGAAWVGSNSSSLTGTKSVLVNGTYIFGISAIGDFCTVYEEVEFTVSVYVTPEGTSSPSPSVTPEPSSDVSHDDIIGVVVAMGVVAFSGGFAGSTIYSRRRRK